MVDRCHELNSKWDSIEQCWVFSGLVSDKVEELDEKYGSELVPVEITFIEELVTVKTWGIKYETNNKHAEK